MCYLACFRAGYDERTTRGLGASGWAGISKLEIRVASICPSVDAEVFRPFDNSPACARLTSRRLPGMLMDVAFLSAILALDGCFSRFC